MRWTGVETKSTGGGSEGTGPVVPALLTGKQSRPSWCWALRQVVREMSLEMQLPAARPSVGPAGRGAGFCGHEEPSVATHQAIAEETSVGGEDGVSESAPAPVGLMSKDLIHLAGTPEDLPVKGPVDRGLLVCGTLPRLGKVLSMACSTAPDTGVEGAECIGELRGSGSVRVWESEARSTPATGPLSVAHLPTSTPGYSEPPGRAER